MVENIEILEKKRKNIEFFTIAFMGRTKAGKSTFHKVITQQSDDDIGIGKTRTTRYNRSWYWDNLRIVDTPGIGAPGGEVDTEIAKSIIDEADVICYVVTSDAIQETEFDFFETIKERNKPLYIILNVKSNLTSEVRLRKFLENPTLWRTSNGRESIEGHFDRIHERLEGKYNMNAVKIIPIHLLAALFGMEDRENSDILLDASNIKEWIRDIKHDVYNSGALKKSLSIIDGTSYQIHSITEKLTEDEYALRKSMENLKKIRHEFNRFVHKEGDKLKSDIKRIFENGQKELCNYASDFSNQHYQDENAGDLWSKDSRVKQISERINETIKMRNEDFTTKLKSKIEETAQDIFIISNVDNKLSVKGENIIDIKLGFNILGVLISGAAPIIITQFWNLPLMVFAGISIAIGIALSLIANLFTSKADKIRRAQENMTKTIVEEVQKNIKENKDKVLKEIDTSIKKIFESIDKIFLTYINGLNGLIETVTATNKQNNNYEQSINSLVGLRVLDYLRRSAVSIKRITTMSEEDLRTNFPVERNWKKLSLTFNYKTKCNDRDIAKAEEATQMKINL